MENYLKNHKHKNNNNNVSIKSLLIREKVTTNSKLRLWKIVKAKKPFSHYLGQTTNKTILPSPTIPADIESLIVPNSIPTKILKEFKTKLSEPLSDMVNVSFNKWKFPDFLKVANVIPVPKKGKKLDCSNYISIYLLSKMRKLYENAMLTWLTNILRKNKVLFPTNLVFEITIQLIIKSHRNDKKNALYNSNFACGVFIDLQSWYSSF